MEAVLTFLKNPMVFQTLAITGKVVFMMTLVMTVGAVLSWVERKQAALMQDRIGANRASIFGVRAMGLVHILTDGLKGITKEDYIPPGVSKFLHSLAPFLACFTTVMAFAVLPFGDTWTIPGFGVIPLTIAPMPGIALLFIFAMMGVGVYSVVISGYVSNNKYGMLGGLRASAQMVSFEITTGLSLIGAIIFYETLDFTSMVAQQAGPIWNWGVFYQPLGFLMFLVAAIVESKRVPFDMPEAESEIIGYFVEYSGMKFLLFLMAEFIEGLLFAWIIVLVFFGGWNFPGLHLDSALGTGINFLGAFVHLPTLAVGALMGAVFTLKIVALLFLQMLIRWSLPRFRYDQIMHLGWKILLPLAVANIAVSAVLALVLKG